MLHADLRRELGGEYWVEYWCQESGWWFEDPAENEIVFVFSWWQAEWHARAMCSTKLRVGDAGKQLANVIMDDGGVGIGTAVQIIDETLDQLRLLDARESESVEWDREVFGAVFHRDHAIAYSLLQEGEVEKVAVGAHDVRRVLTQWREFIQTPPGPQQAEVRCWLQP